jgi:uncharacterized protein with von Willebrand factor type A (vWA) domain
MPPATPRPLLFDAREARIEALDALPRSLWLGGLTHSQGSVEPRLASLVELRAGLYAGSLSQAREWNWPPQPLAQALTGVFDELQLPHYCAGQQELVDTVLMSLLFHLDFIVDYRDRGADTEVATQMALEAFAADWQERCGEMDELTEVFGLLPDAVKNNHWDSLRGLQRSAGWQEVLRIRRLIERLPELTRLIRRLGRAQQTDEADDASRSAAPVMRQASALRERTRSIHVPDLPGETRGIQRSDRVARMLPSEAMLLGHPRLRLVWHARRAERTLLSYEDDDRMQEVYTTEDQVWQPDPRPKPDRKFEMGPILICVDTSGSMQGGAEAVAKATVLEAVRSAQTQGRACHVYAFGGPDEILELTLGTDIAGIERLTRFLGQTFSGGTDICGPLERAVTRLEEADWQLADLLIASDGEFGATPEMAARVADAKQRRGLRVQGILIGDRETIGLLELTDDIYWVRDWRHFGHSDAASPVHSKSLTAMYFPGALRTPENREATVSGGDASAAVRAGERQKNGPWRNKQ